MSNTSGAWRRASGDGAVERLVFGEASLERTGPTSPCMQAGSSYGLGWHCRGRELCDLVRVSRWCVVPSQENEPPRLLGSISPSHSNSIPGQY